MQPREFHVFKLKGAVDPMPSDVVLASYTDQGGEAADGPHLLLEPSEALRFLVLLRTHAVRSIILRWGVPMTGFDLQREADVLAQCAALEARSESEGLVYLRAPELERANTVPAAWMLDRALELVNGARVALVDAQRHGLEGLTDTLDALEDDALGLSSYAEQLKLEGME